MTVSVRETLWLCYWAHRNGQFSYTVLQYQGSSAVFMFICHFVQQAALFNAGGLYQLIPEQGGFLYF